ncbi:unnamed protein product [Calypogeia fissa]
MQKRSLPLDNLLPGIPNEIALREISTKLSWKDFHVLSSVSHGRHHAIQSREVYNARVHSQTRETLTCILYESQRRRMQLALYSKRDGSSYLLPPIPGFEYGGPRHSGCVSLDGSIYVVGGFDDFRSRVVHVLDLAGQTGWKLCASMRELRSDFECGVLHGKIYVFGGNWDQDHSCAEVYDPKTNALSPIRTTIQYNCDHEVESLGDEIFLTNGVCNSTFSPEFVAYHPVNDEWREVDKYSDELPFVAQGKWYFMYSDGIFVHDADQNSRIQLHTFSFPENAKSRHIPIRVQAVDEELLVLWDCNDCEGDFRLFQSKGFCGDAKEILWEKPPLDFAADSIESNLCSLTTVQL